MSEDVAEFYGTVLMRLRIQNYYRKGTTEGRLSVFGDRLVLAGVGIYRFGFREYVIQKSNVDVVGPARPRKFSLTEMVIARAYGIDVISRPGGAFNDRDEFAFRFDTPTLGEVLAAFRDFGYPVALDGW